MEVLLVPIQQVTDGWRAARKVAMRPIRVLAVIGVTIPLVAVATAVSLAGPASAEQPRTSCEHFVSNGNGFQSGAFSRCTQRAATGGSGTFVVNQQVGGIVITWQSGATTDVDDLFITQDTKDRHSCPPNAQKYLWHGTISNDTSGTIPVGGTFSGVVCINFSAGTSGNAKYARVLFG